MKLREWFNGQSKTAHDCAGEVGVHRVTWHRYLDGEDMPRPATVAAVERLTDGQVTAADLTAAYNARRAG